MSALELLPEYVREEINLVLNPAPGTFPRQHLRQDLIAIPAAEAAGCTVSFENNHWHNCARFTRNGIVVWWSGCWRSKAEDAPFRQHPRLYKTLAEALA